MMICLPRQLTIGRDEKTIIAMRRRVSSVADSIGSLKILLKITSEKVIAIKKNKAMEANKDGPWASKNLTHDARLWSPDETIAA